MKRTLPLITTLLLMTATASAQDYGQTATLKIWDNTTAPHSNGITTPETEKGLVPEFAQLETKVGRVI